MQSLFAILDKPMDRSDFLRHVGAGVAILLGGGILTRTLLDTQKHTSTMGYGGSTYGGSKKQG